MKLMSDAEAERLATEVCPENGGSLHCLHHQEGDGDCHHCGEKSWSTAEGGCPRTAEFQKTCCEISLEGSCAHGELGKN